MLGEWLYCPATTLYTASGLFLIPLVHTCTELWIWAYCQAYIALILCCSQLVGYFLFLSYVRVRSCGFKHSVYCTALMLHCAQPGLFLSLSYVCVWGRGFKHIAKHTLPDTMLFAASGPFLRALACAAENSSRILCNDLSYWFIWWPVACTAQGCSLSLSCVHALWVGLYSEACFSIWVTFSVFYSLSPRVPWCRDGWSVASATVRWQVHSNDTV